MLFLPWLGLTCCFGLVSACNRASFQHPFMDTSNPTVLQDVVYGSDHPSQKLDVYLPPAGIAPAPATIVFIHGGAWRSEDKSDHRDLALGILRNSNSPVIAINYRLSPRKEEDGPTVRHPAHALDALAALVFIQEQGSVQLGLPESSLDNIYLVGHSCGAHMINSIILRSPSEKDPIPTPPTLLANIRGVFISEGIYDIDLLLKKFPSYSDFIQNAFGHLESYKEVSPAHFHLRTGVALYWMIVHSKGDKLVDEEQAEAMWDHLWELYDDRSAHHYIEADWERLKLDHNEVLRDSEYPAMVAQFVQETMAKRASHI